MCVREMREGQKQKRAEEEYPPLSHKDEGCSRRPTAEGISPPTSVKGRVFKMWNTSLIHWWWWWWWQNGGWVGV